MIYKSGFTLIEVSIVLVIIGLIVGGVLVGRDLIGAAGVRAQVSQIEKYNAATNTFKTKYGYLPGDIPDPDASKFGFLPRGTVAGEGDGNGILEGNTNGNPGSNGGFFMYIGETGAYWVDLSTARLIDGGFTTAAPTSLNAPTISGTAINQYFPQAKIGRGNYLYIYSGGYTQSDGMNYFGLSASPQFSNGWWMSSTPGLTVQEAYAIDSKIDDGLPQTGNVLAMYYNQGTGVKYYPYWAAGGGLAGASAGPGYSPTTNATTYLNTNCYDNNGVAGVQKYSVVQNAQIVNCALSFKFQ